MSPRTNPHLGGYTAIAIAGLLAGVGLGRVELVAVTGPALLFIVVGLVRTRPITCSVQVLCRTPRALEGDTVAVEVIVDADGPAGEVVVSLSLPEGLTVVSIETDGRPPRAHRPPRQAQARVRSPSGGRVTIEVRLRCERWGAYRLGRLDLVARDRFRLLSYQQHRDPDQALVVYPSPPVIRELLRPVETQLHLGNRTSQRRGGGIEFAELRAYEPGDDPRRIDWRVTARRGQLWVSERHPERNSDVILLVDTLAEARSAGRGTLDVAVRAAAALLAGHLGRRDRVGFLGFGGALEWLRPGMGDRQRYRILDTLVRSRVWTTAVWLETSRVPARVIPPQALVVAVTPLLDDRVAAALAELRGRGFDLVVIEVDPDDYLPAASEPASQLARRLWHLQRDSLRRRFAQQGVATVRWRPEQPLAAALDRASRFRRAAQRGGR